MSLLDAAKSVLDAQIEATSTPPMVVVPQQQWLTAARAVFAAGGGRAEWLTAADFDDYLRIVVHVRTSHDQLLLATDITDLNLSSLTQVWPGLSWHERECSEMFGITFEGSPDSRPLLLAAVPVTKPLRRSTSLTARVARVWPGSVTASGAAVEGPARGRRAVGLAPGVRSEWLEQSSHESEEVHSD
jgi:NADH-quinone oxidoreductase subunit C